MTGETEARKKNPATCKFENEGMGEGEPVALADRTCIVYMGTLVRNGEFFGVDVLDLDADLFFSRSRIWDRHCYWS